MRFDACSCLRWPSYSYAITIPVHAVRRDSSGVRAAAIDNCNHAPRRRDPSQEVLKLARVEGGYAILGALTIRQLNTLSLVMELPVQLFILASTREWSLHRLSQSVRYTGDDRLSVGRHGRHRTNCKPHHAPKQHGSRDQPRPARWRERRRRFPIP